MANLLTVEDSLSQVIGTAGIFNSSILAPGNRIFCLFGMILGSFLLPLGLVGFVSPFLHRCLFLSVDVPLLRRMVK